MVAINSQKARKFMRDLRADISNHIMNLKPNTYEEALEYAKMVEVLVVGNSESPISVLSSNTNNRGGAPLALTSTASRRDLALYLSLPLAHLFVISSSLPSLVITKGRITMILPTIVLTTPALSTGALNISH